MFPWQSQSFGDLSSAETITVWAVGMLDDELRYVRRTAYFTTKAEADKFYDNSGYKEAPRPVKIYGTIEEYIADAQKRR